MSKPAAALERPVARTSFSAAAAAAPRLPGAPTVALPKLPPLAAPAVESDTGSPIAEIVDAKAIDDWGLSGKQPRRGKKLKIAAALVLLAAAGGGYAVYTQMFAANPDGDDTASQNSDVADSGATDVRDPDDAADEPPDQADPFDDAPAIRPNSRSKLATNREPRRIEIAADATPIIGDGAAAGRVRNVPARDSLALDRDDTADIDEETDLRQSEPSETEPDDSADAFRSDLRDSVQRRSPVDRAQSPSQNAGNRRRPSSSGPSLSDDDEEPGLDPEPASGRLDGYQLADKPGMENLRGGSRGRAISIVEAQDEADSDAQLDGYVAEDVNTHRAVSKTVVVRAPGGAARRASVVSSGAFGQETADDGAPVAPDLDDRLARPGTARGADNGTARRGNPLPPAPDDRLQAGSRFRNARLSDDAGDGPEPVSDTYRVAPDDNFWKISRKLYGTARYYQALMRHNEDRVPDPQKLRPGTQILTPPASVLEESYPDLIERGASSKPAGRSDPRTSLRPTFERPLDNLDDDDKKTSGAENEASAGYFYGKSGEPLYRIGHDDTLGSIAQRHLGRASRWQEIYDLNQDVLKSPDNLTLGSVIRLPSDASRVGLAPDGDRRR